MTSHGGLELSWVKRASSSEVLPFHQAGCPTSTSRAEWSQSVLLALTWNIFWNIPCCSTIATRHTLKVCSSSCPLGFSLFFLFVFGLKVYWPSETLLDYYWIAWKAAVYSSIENLLTVANGHTYLAEYSKSKGGKQCVFSHLACFVGGNWLLGGRVIEDEKVVNYGLQLIDTCMHSVEYHFKCLFPHPFHRHIPERSDDDLFT